MSSSVLSYSYSPSVLRLRRDYTVEGHPVKRVIVKTTISRLGKI